MCNSLGHFFMPEQNASQLRFALEGVPFLCFKSWLLFYSHSKIIGTQVMNQNNQSSLKVNILTALYLGSVKICLAILQFVFG